MPLGNSPLSIGGGRGDDLTAREAEFAFGHGGRFWLSFLVRRESTVLGYQDKERIARRKSHLP
jgi:hypothetical protein